MMRNGVRMFLRCAANYGIGLSSIRTICVLMLFFAVFGVIHFILSANKTGIPGSGAIGVPTVRLSGGIPGGQAILQSTPVPVLASLKSVGIVEKKDALKTTVALSSAPEADPVGILEAAKEGQLSVRKNPFVLQLSQGRSGSTLTGTMMLQQHPACGWYIDELLMVVFRTKLADEFGDQTVSAELLLNASQCDFSNKVLWDQSEITRWFTKRDRFANLDRAHSNDYFNVDNLELICKAAARSNPPKAVCSKEIRFLEHTTELLDAAKRLSVPLTLLYLMRDPRGSAMSQLWNYPKMRFKKDKDLRVMGRDLIKEHCRVALKDLRAVESASKEIQTMHICFEDFLSDPKKAMANIYQKIPLFRDWPLHEDGDIGLIPASVATFGKEHSANWGNETYIPKVEVPLAYGEVDHSFSTDISRAKKVDSWKNLYLAGKKYDTMRQEWLVNADCIALRKISHCSNRWQKLDKNE